MLLEFSSPNIVTEFNGKHFRSSLLGAQLAAAYKAQGWDVTQINYLGDYGKPIGLLGVGYEEFGSPELLASEPLSHLRSVYRQISDRFAPELATSKKARDDPKTREAVGETADIESRGIYAKRNAYFSLLESDDQKIVTLWKTLRDASIESYRRTYSRLDIDFDEYAGESQVKAETMSDVITKLKDKNICEESEGSLVVHLNKYRSKHGTAILRDRSGSSTYLLREVAATIERLEKYAFDKMIYVVAHDQHNTHFHRLVKILELLEMSTLGDKLDHVGFAEGSAIPASLVAGEPIDAILDRMEDHMRQNLELEASKLKGLPLGYLTEKTLAATACYSLASSVKRATELKATADSMIGFGPGLVMYPLVWLGRLSELSGTEEEFVKDEEENYLDDDDTAILLRWLAHYPAVVQASFRTAEPAVVMSYIGTVTSHLADAYDEDEKISPVSFEHLRMLVAVRTILANALELLKIIRYVAQMAIGLVTSNLQKGAAEGLWCFLVTLCTSQSTEVRISTNTTYSRCCKALQFYASNAGPNNDTKHRVYCFNFADLTKESSTWK